MAGSITGDKKLQHNLVIDGYKKLREQIYAFGITN